LTKSFHLLILVLFNYIYQLRATSLRLYWNKWINNFSTCTTLTILLYYALRWVNRHWVLVYFINLCSVYKVIEGRNMWRIKKLNCESMWRIKKLNWYHARQIIKLQISLQSHWREKHLSDWSSWLAWHPSIEYKRGICCGKLNPESQGRQPPTATTNHQPPSHYHQLFMFILEFFFFYFQFVYK